MAEDDLRSQFESILESSIVDEPVANLHKPMDAEPRYAGSALEPGREAPASAYAATQPPQTKKKMWPAMALLFATILFLFLAARNRPNTDVTKYPAQNGIREGLLDSDESADPLFQPFDDDAS